MGCRAPSRGLLGGILTALLVVALGAGCRGAAEPPGAAGAPRAGRGEAAGALASSEPRAAAALDAARVEIGWDPATGRGDVRQLLASGDILRTCFHCGYAGYTGGLVIGSENGSGYGLYPAEPIRGFRAINVFCAQDESIWDLDAGRDLGAGRDLDADRDLGAGRDLDAGVEWTYGWSENLGKGPDGQRLEYVRGEIVAAGPDRVTLRSENAGGCYVVTKVATTRAEAPFWVVATRVTNRCDHPVRFDLFTGDDPWIGTYRSSEGDVGWVPGALVRRETAFARGEFQAGGFYDLGNAAAGEAEGAFSGQANFIALDPATPLPDVALFANRFAHRPEEIAPARPLDNRSMTALNLGWLGRRLGPGEGFTFAMALGLATVGEPPAVPQPAEVTDADWSAWRPHLRTSQSGQAGQAGQAPGAAVGFAAERVELELDADRISVTATYVLDNPSPDAAGVGIEYPILTGPERPAPTTVEVNGRTLVPEPRDATSVRVTFPIEIAARGVARFHVRYRQRHIGRHAVYMVTSALSWPRPIGQAVFVVRHSAGLGEVTPSYPWSHTRREGDVVTHTIVRDTFRPDREVELRW